MKNILIVGSGALGSLFAAKLSLRTKITLLSVFTRKSIPTSLRLEQFGENNAKYEMEVGANFQRASMASLTESAASDSSSCFDFCYIFTKGYQTQTALDSLFHSLGEESKKHSLQQIRCFSEETAFVTLQNGIGNTEIITNCLEKAELNRVVPLKNCALIAGTTSEGATLHNNGNTVRHGGKGTTFLSLYKPGPPSSYHKLSELQQLQNEVGLETNIASTQGSYQKLQWSKLLVNACINPITVLYDCCNGEILGNQEAMGIIKQVIQEFLVLARAEGVVLPFQTEEDAMKHVITVAVATKSNVSSMLSDVRRGSQTEIDFINGFIVAKGRELGIPTPVNEMLVEQVKARTKQTVQ